MQESSKLQQVSNDDSMCDDINILDSGEIVDQVQIGAKKMMKKQDENHQKEVSGCQAIEDVDEDDKKRVDSGEGLEASSSNAIWQDNNDTGERDGVDRRRMSEEEAKNNQVVDHHNDFIVTEEDCHISEMSQTFLIEHTKNHITERTNEDSSLC